MPAGDLREPLTRLHAADVIVLREEEREPLETFLEALSRGDGSATHRSLPRPAIWVIRRRLEFEGVDPGAELPKRPLAFCGIARPENFFAMLADKQCRPIEARRFADHHLYSANDVRQLVGRAGELRADSFVTTEKDATKLTGAMRSELARVGPLLIPRLVVNFLYEKRVLEHMIARVSHMDRRRRTPS